MVFKERGAADIIPPPWFIGQSLWGNEFKENKCHK
jgi:hypothetical protein